MSPFTADLFAVANCQMLLWYNFGMPAGDWMLGHMATQTAMQWQMAGHTAATAPIYETLRDKWTGPRRAFCFDGESLR